VPTPHVPWSRWGANVGETFFADVAPLRHKPKVLWRKTLPSDTLLVGDVAPLERVDVSLLDGKAHRIDDVAATDLTCSMAGT